MSWTGGCVSRTGGALLLILVAAGSAPAESAQSSPGGGAEREFSTDFSRHSVDYSEIFSGGPPKDGIPAIDRPRFIAVEEADAWIGPREPVVVVRLGEEVKAYPIQVLMWHELVNDRLDGIPVTVSFCPLCNTAIVFDGRLDGRELDFGTTGRLRFSNLVMYDRQTETWWQQATGEAIAGDLLGERLTTLPGAMISWLEFKVKYPDGQVLSRDTGHSRNYGMNPYRGYDDIRKTPFLYRGPDVDGRLPPMARVITIDAENEAVAYRYETLEAQAVVNDSVSGEPVVVFWKPGAASALDVSTVADGRDVGMVDTFSRKLGNRTLAFAFRDGRFLDDETESTWNIHGEAVDGPLTGKRLVPVVHINHFWFSWAAFRPETRVYSP